MGFWSSFTSFVSKAVDTVKSTASKVWEGVKSVAKSVVNTCVEYGGKIVESVKKVYNAVKPYIKHVKAFVKTVGNTVGLKFPWVKAAAEVIVKGLDFLEKLEKSPLVQKITKHIQWALSILEKIKNTFFNKTEEEEALKRQKDLEEAMGYMETEEQKRSVRFAQLINEYILVRSRIEDALDSFETSNSNNFEHYLRLRATQKLLRVTERKLERAKDLNDISKDDLFLIQMGNKLLAEEPNLSDEELGYLDKLVQRKFGGKSLLPFVFEELIFSWQTKLDGMITDWEREKTELSKLKRESKSLEIKRRVEPLSFEEEMRFNILVDEVKDATYELKEKEQKNRTMEYYVHAAEGFLQLLEKKEEQWIEEGKDWILDEAPEIGMLLIQCTRNDIHWDDLSTDQQSLIRDFALIFRQDSKNRANSIKEEWNNLQEQIEVVA